MLFRSQTSDEMGELWFQVLAPSQRERELLAKDYFAYLVRVTIDFDNFRLRLDPENFAAHTRLGRTLRLMGKHPDAMEHLFSAVRFKPGDDQAHYELALLYLTLEKWPEAEQEFLAEGAAQRDDIAVARLDDAGDFQQAHDDAGPSRRRVHRPGDTGPVRRV